MILYRSKSHSPFLLLFQVPWLVQNAVKAFHPSPFNVKNGIPNPHNPSLDQAAQRSSQTGSHSIAMVLRLLQFLHLVSLGSPVWSVILYWVGKAQKIRTIKVLNVLWSFICFCNELSKPWSKEYVILNCFLNTVFVTSLGGGAEPAGAEAAAFWTCPWLLLLSSGAEWAAPCGIRTSQGDGKAAPGCFCSHL